MTKEEKAQHIIVTATLSQLLIDKIDFLEEKRIHFRQELKKSAKDLRKYSISLGDWFWQSINGEEGEQEVHKLSSAIEKISRLLVDFPPTELDAIENFIKTKKELPKNSS